MNKSLSPRILPASAQNYLRRVVADGGTIGKFFAASCDLVRGRVFTFLPPGISARSLSDYARGGVTSSELSRCYLSQYVLDEVGMNPDIRLVLFENRFARPGDAFLARCRSSVAFLDQEVYHFWHSAEREERLIDVIVESATAIETAGFIFELHEAANNVTASTDWLSNFQDWECVSMIASAFDGEGYVIWHS
jgi:hypothetical protein